MSRIQQVLWAVVVVVIMGGVYLWWSSSQTQTAGPSVEVGMQQVPGTQTNATAQQINSSNSGSGVSVSAGVSAQTSTPTKVTVTFDGSSFKPSNVTISQGGTVTFVSVAGPMWVASNPHPIHNGYDGTTAQQHCAPGYSGPAPFDQCEESNMFSFTFNKVGTWGYHDHLDHGVSGTVTVVAR